MVWTTIESQGHLSCTSQRAELRASGIGDHGCSLGLYKQWGLYLDPFGTKEDFVSFQKNKNKFMYLGAATVKESAYFNWPILNYCVCVYQ